MLQKEGNQLSPGGLTVLLLKQQIRALVPEAGERSRSFHVFFKNWFSCLLLYVACRDPYVAPFTWNVRETKAEG